MAVRTWSMRAFQRASDRAGRLLLSPLSSAQHLQRHYHVPAVTRTSFVRSFTVSADDRRVSNGEAPSPLYRQLAHANDRCFNTRGFGSWNAGSIHGVWRHMSSSISGEPTTKPDQPPYFEGPWYEKYLLLEEYKKGHGNCLVPKSFVYDDIKLGKWVSDQRTRYKRGRLSQSRREMLDALGFSWDPYADRWERKFALLEQFKNRNGHCNVPYSHEEDGVKLGIWLSSQRQGRGKMEESLQRRLEQLGVSWDPYADRWEWKFALLEQFKEREGHCNVSITYEEDGINLGTWLCTQRMAMKRGKLDGSYQSRLEELGVSWDPWHDQWERNFGLLEKFKEREGHCNVINRHVEDGIKLGFWLDTQRMAMKEGKLNELYQRRLDKLGVSWDPLADQWEQNFALLEQFKEREGHCNVPYSHEEDGVKLGFWLSNQRQGRVKMEESLQRRLEQLGVSWNPQADEWEWKFALLEKFKEREGHCNISRTYEEDGINLGAWLHTMRQVRKGNREGNLSSERIERLDEVGIRW